MDEKLSFTRCNFYFDILLVKMLHEQFINSDIHCKPVDMRSVT
jgi:hypothetical protein